MNIARVAKVIFVIGVLMAACGLSSWVIFSATPWAEIHQIPAGMNAEIVLYGWTTVSTTQEVEFRFRRFDPKVLVENANETSFFLLAREIEVSDNVLTLGDWVSDQLSAGSSLSISSAQPLRGWQATVRNPRVRWEQTEVTMTQPEGLPFTVIVTGEAEARTNLTLGLIWIGTFMTIAIGQAAFWRPSTATTN